MWLKNQPTKFGQDEPPPQHANPPKQQAQSSHINNPPPVLHPVQYKQPVNYARNCFGQPGQVNLQVYQPIVMQPQYYFEKTYNTPCVDAQLEELRQIRLRFLHQMPSDTGIVVEAEEEKLFRANRNGRNS